MKENLINYCLFVSWGGKLVEVTLEKEDDVYFAEARINGKAHLAKGETSLMALASVMPPVFTTQAHRYLKNQNGHLADEEEFLFLRGGE